MKNHSRLMLHSGHLITKASRLAPRVAARLMTRRLMRHGGLGRSIIFVYESVHLLTFLLGRDHYFQVITP